MNLDTNPEGLELRRARRGALYRNRIANALTSHKFLYIVRILDEVERSETIDDLRAEYPNLEFTVRGRTKICARSLVRPASIMRTIQALDESGTLTFEESLARAGKRLTLSTQVVRESRIQHAKSVASNVADLARAALERRR